MDEVTLHSDRIRLWGEFNTAWLSIFQKQKDMLESGQRIQHPETLMTQEFIKKMAKDLIRMCDAVEKHGLVDYQYGVAEEQIIISKFFLKKFHMAIDVELIFSCFGMPRYSRVNREPYRKRQHGPSTTLNYFHLIFQILSVIHKRYCTAAMILLCDGICSLVETQARNEVHRSKNLVQSRDQILSLHYCHRRVS